MFLEPLMRSPHDVSGGKAEYYSAGMQPYMEYEDIIPKQNRFKALLKRGLIFLRCGHRRRSSSEVVEAELDNLYPQRLSAFGEIELNKIPSDLFFGPRVDVGVQTSSSLDIEVLNLTSSYNKNKDYEPHGISESLEHMALMEADLDSNHPCDELNELSVLQFFRRERSRSTGSHINQFDDDSDGPHVSGIQHEHPHEEKEIRTHVYNPEHYATDETMVPEQVNDPTADKKPEVIRKHLRFREETVVIPFQDDDDNDENLPGGSRRSIVLGTSRVFRLQDMSNDPNDGDEPSGGTGREFKSYFNWGKERKKKKTKKK